MEMPRRLINLIGTSAVAVIVLAGSPPAVVPLFGAAQNAYAQVEAAANYNQLLRAELADIAKQDERVTDLRSDLDLLRTQIPAQDELRDASVLASKAAKSAGARIVAITFADRQVFAAPSGVGIGDDGTPTAPQAKAEPNTLSLQLLVTFEVEVSSTAQAAAFLEGLRSGPRMLQVVQAQCGPTSDAKRFTVTVDALIFAVRG